MILWSVGRGAASYTIDSPGRLGSYVAVSASITRRCSKLINTHWSPATAKTNIVDARRLLVVPLALVVREEEREASHRRELCRPGVSAGSRGVNLLDLILCTLARLDNVKLLRRFAGLGIGEVESSAIDELRCVSRWMRCGTLSVNAPHASRLDGSRRARPSV